MALIDDGRVGDQVLERTMVGLTEQLKEMAALYAQTAKPEYYVSPPIPLNGNDVSIPPMAVIAIVQNPSGSPLALTIGALAHSIPAQQLAVFPTLKANRLTCAGPGTVVFSNRYPDRGFVQQGTSSGSGPSPATTVVGPDAYSAPPVVGVSALYARGDHDHGLPAAPSGGTPATAVTGPDAFGASPVVGTGTNYARQDHDHGLPANPAPSPATTVTGPDAFGASAVVGTGTNYARQDHDHGLPAQHAASTTVTGPDAFGASAVVGSSTLYARGDHDHGLPANPAPSPATTVTGPDAFGASAVVGTGTLYARNDHTHGLPANPVPLSTPLAGSLSSQVALTANTLTTLMTSGSLAIGTWLVSFNASWGFTTNVAIIEFMIALGTASGSISGAASNAAGLPGSTGIRGSSAMTVLVTVATAGTVLFQAETADTTSDALIYATTPTYAFGQATGWTATRVA